MTRVTVDITKLLKVGLDLLEQAHYIFHSMLHLTELYQCTPQLSLTPATHTYNYQRMYGEAGM